MTNGKCERHLKKHERRLGKYERHLKKYERRLGKCERRLRKCERRLGKCERRLGNANAVWDCSYISSTKKRAVATDIILQFRKLDDKVARVARFSHVYYARA